MKQATIDRDDFNARMALSCVLEPGAAGSLGFDPQKMWHILQSAEGQVGDRVRHLNVEQVAEQAAAAGIRFIVPGDPEWVPPSRPRIQARSRLIAALSQGTVMVEAAARSGARSTLDWAIRLGRPAMAVPGPVTSATSWGPNQAIRDGSATLVTCAADIHSHIHPDPLCASADPASCPAAAIGTQQPADLCGVTGAELSTELCVGKSPSW
jgi:predicted Rossmann fold nucleotide-binding protein DprA/Smf involved in DNA uptake